MWQIYRKEVNGFLNSLIGYIVIAVFLTLTGLLIWVFPETSVLNYGYADMETLFSLTPYVFIFLVPAITMRTFAEEKKSGTMELLLTKPVSDIGLIVGKFLAGFTLVIFAVIPTFVYYYSISALGNPPGNIDSAGVAGSYIGLILLGGVFTSVGVLASSVTENQIIAFILGVFFCFFLYQGFASLAPLSGLGKTANLLEQFGILFHYSAMSKGLIDSRNLIYFGSVIALMLSSTDLVLSAKKW